MTAPPETPIDLVIRFSTSNPDLIFSISTPSSTSALSLKQQIRARLPGSKSRLRLIHAGKVLPDDTALSNSVKFTLPPSSPRNDDSKSAKAKGKQAVRESKPPAARVYIHCSVGDALTPSEISAEAESARDADAALVARVQPSATTPSAPSATHDASTTTPAPRGFNRLLSAGFTPAEVATLRTQFLAIQAHTHTPDTMPNGPELLALEERWLDNGSNAATAGAEDTGGFGSEDSGGLEDILYGSLIGFFWPIGAMCWLTREEGVWTQRRQLTVLSGFVFNLALGIMRLMV